MQEKGELSLSGGASGPTQREQAELVGPVNARKYSLPVLEIVETDKPLLRDSFIKKGFRRIIGGNTGWHDQPRAPSWADQA